VTTYVEAQFIGQTDTAFHPRHTYQLRIIQRWNKQVVVVVTHGYTFKPITGMQQTYANLKQLLQDWLILRVVNPQPLDDESTATP
jgi:hypothetical protein